MNMTKLKMLGRSCAYFLLIAFSASVSGCCAIAMPLSLGSIAARPTQRLSIGRQDNARSETGDYEGRLVAC